MERRRPTQANNSAPVSAKSFSEYMRKQAEWGKTVSQTFVLLLEGQMKPRHEIPRGGKAYLYK